MVTDHQVRRLFMLEGKGIGKTQAADKAGMDPKTALRYRNCRQLPSQMRPEHTWRTRHDPFSGVWEDIQKMLEVNPGLQAKTVLADLCARNPEKFQQKHLRTLQRRFRDWRATEGPAREVFFPQVHHPGDLCASDFTHMDSLNVTIRREAFKHLLYHFVLTYSNWETVTICYSESFESLCCGLQNALWELGGVPERHRSDRMSAAVNKDCNPEHFTTRYQALLRHYHVKPERTNAACANENGDVESSHRHLKKAIAQALMLRGSRDFESVQEYDKFIRTIVAQRNAGRRERLEEEHEHLRRLPLRRFDDHTETRVRVSPNSTINVGHNIYSVHSRLIGEYVHVRTYVDHLEVWYGTKCVEKLQRLRGRSGHKINYRHIIDWLVRKPGALTDYRYKADLFPSSWLRMAYDWLKSNLPLAANREYVQILHTAAYESQTAVENAIRHLLETNQPVTALSVKEQVRQRLNPSQPTDVHVETPSLCQYDGLLEGVVCHG